MFAAKGNRPIDRERIGLNDTTMDIYMKLSEGNPGAVSVLAQVTKGYTKIDPDSALASLSPLLSFDSHGIYGSKIWLLWKDVCGQCEVKLATLFRASQLGIMRHDLIHKAVQNEMALGTFDFADLNAKVREQLPDFAALPV